MRKLLSLLAAFTLIAGLAACSNALHKDPAVTEVSGQINATHAEAELVLRLWSDVDETEMEFARTTIKGDGSFSLPLPKTLPAHYLSNPSESHEGESPDECFGGINAALTVVHGFSLEQNGAQYAFVHLGAHEKTDTSLTIRGVSFGYSDRDLKFAKTCTAGSEEHGSATETISVDLREGWNTLLITDEETEKEMPGGSISHEHHSMKSGRIPTNVEWQVDEF